MFVLELTYTAPLDAVNALHTDHMAWLGEQFEKGVFLASGRKNPRDGGVILAVAEDRARIEEIVAADPYTAGEVCAYRITEFTATTTVPELARYRQTPD
ncbi:YciI family protein [Streptomyces sp. CMSTAAHL-2]|uniref:YciI family protein n=1 Tax=Streptomyces sp. CMSTAAHL-2 TaxID=2904522 RepID=UPI001E3B0629|nr:YciI family protein [Streptomyces sp. CMSTAAHL-2]MCE3030153.1 YciI family protein [Streptomyces sp. CMSTAAHL-2]